MRRRSFFEEGLTRELVVLSVKLIAVILALWFCLKILPDEVNEIANYLLSSPAIP